MQPAPYSSGLTAPQTTFSDRCPMASAKADLIQAIAAIPLPEVGDTSDDHRQLARALQKIEVALDAFGFHVGGRIHAQIRTDQLSASDYLMVGTDLFEGLTFALKREADDLDESEADERREATPVAHRLFRRGRAA